MNNEFNWKLELTFDGITYLYEWYEEYYKSNPVGYYGKITATDTGEDIRNNEIAKFVTAAAIAFRVEQIRAERKSLDIALHRPDALKNLIMQYVERAQKGEFLGQYNIQIFYVQHVAALLDLPMSYVSDLVAELIQEERVGLTGNIFITYEEYAEDRKRAYEDTGHKSFFASDWGYWSCGACGNSGDPEDPETADASKIPCTPPIDIAK
jgi:hypothetical protein